MGRSTSGAALAAPFIVAIAVLTLMVAPAGATTGHTVTATFGLQGSNDPGGFPGGSPSGVVVRQATGDVFVTDPAHTDGGGLAAPRVEQFDAAGAFQAEFPIDPNLYNSPQAIAIDPNNGGALYVGVNDSSFQGTVLKYALDGTLQHALAAATDTALNPSAVAVDPSTGDVYVGATDTTTNAPIVEVFDDAGTFQTRFDGSANNDAALGGVGAIAVDGSDRVYVTDTGKNRVDRFDAAGTFQATVVDGNARGVGLGALAADPSDDELYVVENNGQVEAFTSGGAAHQDVFNPSGAFITGVAVDGGTDTVYLADQGQSLGLIATTFAGPTVATGSATAVDVTTATLNGTINPESIDANVHFEYGTDGNYGSSTPDVPAGDDSVDAPAAAPVTDLAPNTTYHFRIVGTNANGAIAGADQTFTTLPAPPLLDGAPPFASDIKPDGATLNGTINPRGSSTTYSVEYGTTTLYGSTEPGSQPLDGQGDQVGSIPVTGLTPGTTYHFRFVADNGTGGTQTGADGTFTTAPATAAGASSVTSTSAELTGVVDPQPGHPNTYHFEYGETTGYGSATPERGAGSGSGVTTVTASIDGLKPGTTYHVRVIATDTTNGITTTGVDGTFTTNPAAVVTTGAVTGVTARAATFSGDVDTHGLGGTYRFYVQSSTSTYNSRTDAATIPAGAGPGPVSATLTDLLPGQTYTVRLAVDSSRYTAVGDTVTFTTAPLPPVAPPPPPPAAVTTPNPYGCVAPSLKAYNSHPRAGDTITVEGTDLGVGGTVALGSETLTPASWSSTSFTFALPDDAKGSLPLTINCGRVSNTIAVQMYQAPSNTFATPKAKVRGTTATVTLKVPGPGDITVRGAGVKTAKRHVGKAGSYSVKATLSAAGRASLRRHHSLARTLTVSFRPNGGTAAKKAVKVTFRR